MNMSGDEFISDYDDHKKEIEYWFSIKCEEKYRAFSDLLPEEKRTWKQISDLYRYERRLAFNVFRYLSFLEEYLRAIVVRKSKDRSKAYEKYQKSDLNVLINTYCKDNINAENDLNPVRLLRNSVDHSKIIFDSRNFEGSTFKDCFYALGRQLPTNYRSGFEKDINNCLHELEIDEEFKIVLNFE